MSLSSMYTSTLLIIYSAFIAASRRKDRSLDARLESANRASMLHKKRTGKAFHITKEIVEKEAMYEEIDERYQEKRIRMLQAQNIQIEEQFHRHLLAAFAARANSNSSSIAHRRSAVGPRGSVDAGSRKMSLDLSSLSSPYSQGVTSSNIASPMAASDSYMLSPTATFDSNAQSYMNCMDTSDPSYSMATTGPSTQVPAYVAHTPAPSAPSWSTAQLQTPSWAMHSMPTPMQTPNDTQAVHMWQQQMMQQSQLPADTAASIQMRQFRERLASAPELPVQQIPTPAPSAPAPAPTVSASISGPSGHSRGHSQPSNNYHSLQLLTQGTHLAAQMAPQSSNGSPRAEALSAETQSTPDFCPTPNTPLSPTATSFGNRVMAMPGKQEDGLMVSGEELDPDFNEFSQFALGLGNSSQERETFGFDDFVTLDDFTTVSC